jgi:hypothetical protein
MMETHDCFGPLVENWEELADPGRWLPLPPPRVMFVASWRPLAKGRLEILPPGRQGAWCGVWRRGACGRPLPPRLGGPNPHRGGARVRLPRDPEDLAPGTGEVEARTQDLRGAGPAAWSSPGGRCHRYALLSSSEWTEPRSADGATTDSCWPGSPDAVKTVSAEFPEGKGAS